MIIQRLARQYDEALEKAIAYYSVICTLNGIKLGNREIQLLAFTAVRGTITPKPAREEFAKLFGSSLHTIENAKGVLVKNKLLVKDGDMYRVNPVITLDFNQPLTLVITLNNGDDEEHESDGVPDKEDIKTVADRREHSGKGNTTPVEVSK